MGAERTCGPAAPFCTGAEPFCSRAESFCTGAEPLCSSAESFCTGAEPLCSSAESFCAGAKPLCSGAESSCTGAEPFRSSAESFCTTSEPFCTGEKWGKPFCGAQNQSARRRIVGFGARFHAGRISTQAAAGASAKDIWHRPPSGAAAGTLNQTRSFWPWESSWVGRGGQSPAHFRRDAPRPPLAELPIRPVFSVRSRRRSRAPGLPSQSPKVVRPPKA